MKKKILLLFTLITMLGVQQVQANNLVDGLMAYLKSVFLCPIARGIESYTTMTKQQPYVVPGILASGAAVAGGLMFAKWYWSPEKIQQRQEAILASAQARARQLYPARIVPLQKCIEIAQKDLAETNKEIERRKRQGQKLFAAQRHAKVLKGVIYYAGQEIKNVARTIYGSYEPTRFLLLIKELYKGNECDYLGSDMKAYQEKVENLVEYIKAFYTSCRQGGIEITVPDQMGQEKFDELYHSLDSSFAFVYFA